MGTFGCGWKPRYGILARRQSYQKIKNEPGPKNRKQAEMYQQLVRIYRATGASRFGLGALDDSSSFDGQSTLFNNGLPRLAYYYILRELA